MSDKGSYLQIFKDSVRLLSPVFRRRLLWTILGLLLSAVIDVLSFTALIPAIYLVNDTAPIFHNRYLHFVYNLFHFQSEKYFIALLFILVAGIFTVKNLILLINAYWQNKFVYRVANDLFRRQINRFYGNTYLDVRQMNSVEYLRYIATAPQYFASSVLMPQLQIIYEMIVGIIVVLALVFYFPMVFLLVVLTIFPVAYFLLRRSKKILARISEERGRNEVESYRKVLEGIQAYMDIKFAAKENAFISGMVSSFDRMYHLAVRTSILQWVPRRTIEVMVVLSICIIYTTLALFFEVKSEDLVVTLITFATASYRLMPSVNDIIHNLVGLKSVRYIFSHLSRIKPAETIPDLNRIDTFEHVMRLDQVSCQYTASPFPVISDINLVVHPGDFIVISGESGSGKSTLGRVILGLIKPGSGKYSMDDIGVQSFLQVRHLFAYVTQDFYLFDTTLEQNITVGEDPDQIDYVRLQQVLEISRLSDLVHHLPGGLQYRVGEMGSNLSGGQKQRIAIARALYKNARILVLDEITSALDRQNEGEVLNSVYEIAKANGLTVFLITHRIDALKQYDAHYRMDKGRLTKMAPDNIS